MKKRRRLILVIAAVIIVVGTIAAIRLHARSPKLSTAEAKTEEFVTYVELRGELKATRSVLLSAPVAGVDLQILQLVTSGQTVKAGDVVVQFETTTLQRTVEQRTTELRQAEAEIERTRAQMRLDREQKVTDSLKAKYDVERARLEASKQEIVSEIDAEKSKLALADSQERLRDREQKITSSDATARANLEMAQNKRRKALYDLQLAQKQLASLTLRAPAAGIVTLGQNNRARVAGGASPEFKTGDRVWSGAVIAELPDMATIRVFGMVDETDRGKLHRDQPATVRIDAIPDREFSVRVAEISPLARPDFSSWPPVKNFDVALQVVDPDQRMRPGMSATARIVVNRVPNALVLPTEALFQDNGRTVVFVVRGTSVEERQITVSARSAGKVMVTSGLKAGERVSLQDPRQESTK